MSKCYGECIGRYFDEDWISIRGWVTKEDAQDTLTQEYGEDVIVGNIEHVYSRFGFRSDEGERTLGWSECKKGRGAFKSTRAEFGYV